MWLFGSHAEVHYYQLEILYKDSCGCYAASFKQINLDYCRNTK